MEIEATPVATLMEGVGTAHEGSQIQLVISPNLTKYWIPIVQPDIKPKVGMLFPNLDIAMDFYRNYGANGGFDVRTSTKKRFRSGVVSKQYIVCNRQGFKPEIEQNTSKSMPQLPPESCGVQRQRVSKRVGCKARVIFEYDGNGYKIAEFEERHCHSLVLETLYLNANRQLNYGHRKFVLNCVKANIGPAKTHRLYREMLGGYDNVGALAIDFKNYKRELMTYMSGADAQLIIQKFHNKQEVCPDMAFEYAVDGNNQLSRIFWADPISRKNYLMFGDVVSFDATYNTNRYKMVFVPFTGIDNHKKCVTYAAGLIVKEDEESYIWLLENFLKAMGHEPYYVVTDQDPAMKNAIRATFKRARHRLCMWHIMEKVNVKVGPTLAKDNTFIKRLNDIVWNSYITPCEFEEKWGNLMNDFALTENQWFRNLFEIKKSWIPAYFKDVKMGGLLRTTSRSESANSWFGSYISPQANLVEFFMHFESAMDAQRHVSRKMHHECVSSPAECKTPLEIEKHAAKVYTKTVFSELQTEIEAACFRCVPIHIQNENDVTRYKVVEASRDDIDFIVDKCRDSVNCSCKVFEQFGLLCRHILMLIKDLDRIPDQYLLNRWLKAASSSSEFENGKLAAVNRKSQQNAYAYISKIWSDFHCCVSLAQDDENKLARLSRILNEEKNYLLSGRQDRGSVLSKEAVMEAFCGSVSNLDVNILPPKQAKNKGSGSSTRSRLLSQREKSIKASQRLKRRCGKCGEIGNHNSRTCTKTNENFDCNT